MNKKCVTTYGKTPPSTFAEGDYVKLHKHTSTVWLHHFSNVITQVCLISKSPFRVLGIHKFFRNSVRKHDSCQPQPIFPALECVDGFPCCQGIPDSMPSFLQTHNRVILSCFTKYLLSTRNTVSILDSRNTVLLIARLVHLNLKTGIWVKHLWAAIFISSPLP